MKIPAEIERYLTTSQAAKISSVTRFTIANWAKKGLLKVSYTAGGHRRISQESLKEFIQAHCKARPLGMKASKNHKIASAIKKRIYDTGKFIGMIRNLADKRQ